MTRKCFLALLVLLAVPVARAIACECVHLSQGESRAEADVVFRGRALSIRVLSSEFRGRAGVVQPSITQLAAHQVVEFLVDAVWKGKVEWKARVFVTSHPHMCDGYEFRLGSDYVIYIGRLPLLPESYLDRLRARVGLTVDPLSNTDTFDMPNCPLRIRFVVAAESNPLGAPRLFK